MKGIIRYFVLFIVLFDLEILSYYLLYIFFLDIQNKVYLFGNNYEYVIISKEFL